MTELKHVHFHLSSLSSPLSSSKEIFEETAPYYEQYLSKSWIIVIQHLQS